MESLSSPCRRQPGPLASVHGTIANRGDPQPAVSRRRSGCGERSLSSPLAGLFGLGEVCTSRNSCSSSRIDSWDAMTTYPSFSNMATRSRGKLRPSHSHSSNPSGRIARPHSRGRRPASLRGCQLARTRNRRYWQSTGCRCRPKDSYTTAKTSGGLCGRPCKDELQGCHLGSSPPSWMKVDEVLQTVERLVWSPHVRRW